MIWDIMKAAGDIAVGAALTAWRLITLPAAGPLFAMVAFLLLMQSCSLRSSVNAIGAELTKEQGRHNLTKTDLTNCRASFRNTEAEWKRQNEALEAGKRAAEQSTREAAKGLSAALRGRAKAEANATAILTTNMAGLDACQRAERAAESVRQNLR